MSRVLIAIGCNEYDSENLNNLSGAVADAKGIFDRLVSGGLGAFDVHSSRLLLSPTLSEVRETITGVLFNGAAVDVLSIFYAGHGGIKDGSYFLMCRDSYTNCLSVSALPVSQLFGWLSEAKCLHADLIIDSCQSGGVVHDFGALLKPDVIGKSNGLSVSMLVAASSDQYASETNGQGICTSAVIDCIDGKLQVPSQRSTLDLVEVGQVVSEAVAKKSEQKPLVWGLSLYGHIPLCRNPTFTGENFLEGASALIGANSQLASDKIKSHSDVLWMEYYEIESDFSVERLMARLANVVDDLSDNPSFVADFMSGISSALSQQVSRRYSGFEEAQVLGVSVAALLRCATKSAEVDRAILDLCYQICSAVDRGVFDLNADLSEYEYNLLSKHSGLADLFYLPLRILSILGWVACAKHISIVLECPFQEAQAKDLVRLLVDRYGTSIVSVSDAQAPHLATFLSVGEEMELREESEAMLGLMFNSFLAAGGKVAQTGIRSEDVLLFLRKRLLKEMADSETMVAHPSELLSVFMVCYPKFGMKEEIDQCMREMDYFNFNIFRPETYLDFAMPLIEKGINYSYLIGDGVWRVDEFVPSWNSISATIASDQSLGFPAVRLGAIVSALLFPNRVAWFVFSEIAADGAEG